MTDKQKTAALHNLGCKVNAYETEKMAALLADSGYSIVPFTEEADLYVINTCSVTAIADKKSRQMIHRARRRNPAALVVACGCYVQQQNISPEALGCDIIIGNDEKSRLIEITEAYLRDHGSSVIRHEINSAKEIYEDWDCSQDYRTPESRTRAFIKIQDGCDRFCSYCLIPYVRGRTRSRDAASVLNEIDNVIKKGCMEVVLTGIHLSSYNDGDNTLIDLCEEIDRKTSIRRLRLSSLEPTIVTGDFAARLSKLDCICPHFHLSLQSGSDTVIRRMNRSYTTADFARGVEFLRTYFKDPAITTDVIAGFPGESEEEFLRGKVFLTQIRFAQMHVFPYSVREGTKAASMPGQLPNSIKQSRANELIALSEQMTENYHLLWRGRSAEVLFEEDELVGGKHLWRGFTREYIRVYRASDENLANTIRMETI